MRYASKQISLANRNIPIQKTVTKKLFLQSTRNSVATDPLTFFSEIASQRPSLERIGGPDNSNSARKKCKSYATDPLTFFSEIASQRLNFKRIGGKDDSNSAREKRKSYDCSEILKRLEMHSVISNKLKSVMSGTVIDINREDELLIRIFNLHYAILKRLIDKGGDVNARNQDGITPLDFAIAKGDVEFIKLLIDKGGDVNARNQDGITPLHWVAYKGYEVIVKALVIAGANIKATDNNGSTVLDYAAQGGYTGRVEKAIEEGTKEFISFLNLYF
ncbi:MAG: hypothetical protein CMP21_07755 [Rickettsiales bacterium]|nr:hypothetical protein [Rickettsiales bacterium]